MTDLVEFLRARLDEDEYAARRAGDKHPCWIYDHEKFSVTADESIWSICARRSDGQRICDVDGEHISRWDPARVLVEVEAKRRIIDEHTINDPCDAHDASLRSIPCATLELLALPYADHPDYDPAWSLRAAEGPPSYHGR